MHANTAAFIKLVHHPVKFKMFLLLKLPSAFFAGVRIVSMDENTCRVSVPYKWFSQNPFRSTYFACLSMAAEMSTGALAMACVYHSTPEVSMLITGIEGNFIRKATALTTFICEDGKQISAAISAAIDSGLPQTVKIKSTGRNNQGEIVAEFNFAWSFKVKTVKGSNQ